MCWILPEKPAEMSMFSIDKIRNVKPKILKAMFRLNSSLFSSIK